MTRERKQKGNERKNALEASANKNKRSKGQKKIRMKKPKKERHSSVERRYRVTIKKSVARNNDQVKTKRTEKKEKKEITARTTKLADIPRNGG